MEAERGWGTCFLDGLDSLDTQGAFCLRVTSAPILS